MRQGLVVVHQHDARVAARHQAVGQHFQAPQRRRHCVQQVAAGVAAGFAHVEHGDLRLAAQRFLQPGGRQARMVNRGRRRKGAVGAAGGALEHHAAVQAVKRHAVEMQVRAGRVAHQFDGVHVGRSQHDGIARRHVHSSHVGQHVAPGLIAGAARIDLVALVAGDAGDDGPGGVVVRRLRLAGLAQRQVQRVAAVGVFGQAVDRGGPSGHHGEGLGRKQFRAASERFEQTGHRGQLFGRGARGVRRQRLDLRDEVAHGAGAFGIVAESGGGRVGMGAHGIRNSWG